MVSFRKRGDKWQARVHRRDHCPVVKSFNTKADAVKWARHTESQLDLGTLAPKAAMPPLIRIVDRYLAEVTPTKKGAAQELNRGRQIARRPLGSMQLDKITSEVLSKYRDARLHEVSNNTVRLELAFISVVFEQCAKEWGYRVSNPVKQIRIPKPGNPRQRRLRPERFTPLEERLRRLLSQMPEEVIAQGLSLDELRRLLAGKWRGNCHPGELGAALRKLGFVRGRDWSGAVGGFRARWIRQPF
jgi:hypothetical protein